MGRTGFWREQLRELSHQSIHVQSVGLGFRAFTVCPRENYVGCIDSICLPPKLAELGAG